MKISECPEELKSYMEYGCIVCMCNMRKGNPKYNGCSCRARDKYCPWQEEAIITAMKSENKDKQDIFSKWAEIPIVKETLKKQAEIVPKDKMIYTNYGGLK
jgi:hypothetical protein